jgi:hypothetical protein
MPKIPPLPLKATMSRETVYEDGSGPRCRVSYDSGYRLGDDDCSFVQIHGVGGEVHVHMKDVSMMIEALQEAQTLDRQVRLANK